MIPMQRLVLRILSRFSRKTFIRSAWKNLNSLNEHDELVDALEALISMSHEENEFIELITVIADVLSEAPMASAFLCHIIDSAALPSKETSHKITTRLLQKLKPGLCRTKPKKRIRVNVSIMWSVLAEKLAGEISLSLFTDSVCNTLLDYLQNDNDPRVRLFALIALEKFGMTGQNKQKILSAEKDIHKILQVLLKELYSNENSTIDVYRKRQLKFCVDWALKNTFDSGKGIIRNPDDSSINHNNINVMMNPLDATAHWKLSPNGLEIRNDNFAFESIRATAGVTSGKWFYEVLLLTNGIMQIGYATKRCTFGPEEGTGIGDDHYGFAYDGCRNILWANGISVPYGGNVPWKPGDVVGVYMDINLGCVRFFLNGKDLGMVHPLNIAQFRKLAESGLHPALSFTSYQQAIVNFGTEKFRYPPSSLSYEKLNNHVQLSAELRDSIQKRTSRYRSISISSSLKQQFETTEDDFDAQCSICFAMPPCIILGPCNHDGFCVECAKMMNLCPLCRCPISSRRPMNNNNLPPSPTKLSSSSTSISSSIPSTAIVLPPTPPDSRSEYSIPSLEPDVSRGLEP
ncbi:concanavalin A-like lectin/glucanase domain-containing protein [Gigaspora rosea]|uniref:Concanavalin A-like lectin/glucanase domain-containing protein n=1 Tax=Gigaspora rosea TaxID=44941 RepID=A0A397V8B7_9GLOM|nr:concanavalin A-like lectin/glucanase domain-containing protein [Gigaspora rosea]